MSAGEDDLVAALLVKLDGVAEPEVREVLKELELETKERPPKRAQLTLKRLRFAGERNGDLKFYPGVNVIRSGNLKGKTTILQLIQLCLTGSLKLKPDMSKWITLVDLDFDLDATSYTVHVDRTGPRPQGHLASGSMDVPATDARERREFKNAKEMAATLENFFSEKLVLEVLHGTQKDSRKDSDALLINTTSYETYFKGLYINQDSGYLHLVTDTFFSSQYTKIVGMLLGYRGLRPYFEADTKLALTKNELAKEEAHVRRNEAETAAGRSSDEISKELEAATRKVDELKLKRAEALVRATSPDIDLRLARVTEDLVQAREGAALAQEELTDAERVRDADEAVVVALKDAIASKHHFSALAPHHCPVCETAITKSRTQVRQGKGQCLLCAEDVNPHSDKQMLALLHSRLSEAEGALKSKEAAFRSAKRGVQAANELAASLAQEKLRLQTQLRAAHTDGSLAEAQLEKEIRRVGKLEAEREEAQRVASRSATDSKVAALSMKRRVLEALVSHLRTAHGLANEQVKLLFSARVLDYLTRCGVGNIESVRLDAQLKPELVQNGSTLGFSDLSAGEKLRFVLAFFFALAISPAEDIPAAAHPGLLLIDSPGKEEMVEKDFKAVVGLLRFIDEHHASQVQAIVATTYRDIRDAAPPERVRFIDNDEDFLFP